VTLLTHCSSAPVFLYYRGGVWLFCVFKCLHWRVLCTCT